MQTQAAMGLPTRRLSLTREAVYSLLAFMGDMQLTLGLSGWTTNDWTRGSALDLLAPPRHQRRS